VNGWQRAGQAHRLTQFLQSQIRPANQQCAHLLTMRLDNEGFAARITMARLDVSGTPTLLQELLDHAQRYPVTLGHLFPSALFLIVRSQDSFA
jgi:hypothetical protein